MQDLTPIQKEVDEFLYNFQVIEIETPKQYTEAGDMLKEIKMKATKLEDKRKEYTKPLLDQKKLIDTDFKKLIDPLNDFIKQVKEKMVLFQIEEQKRLDKVQEEIDKKALETGKSEVEVEVVNDIKTQRGDVATTTVKKVWNFEIEDAKKIPREFLKVDETLIRSAVRDGARKIEGVYIFEDRQISIR